MATCKDCLHSNDCKSKVLPIPLSDSYIQESKCVEKRCGYYKDRSRFVELPCKIGTELFRIKQINGKRFITNTALNSNTFWNIVIQGEFGKTVFLTREEAEKALKECENSA